MPNHMAHEGPTCNVLAWSSHAANVESLPEEESAADADEPPDDRPLGMSPAAKRFQKSTVRPAADCQSSLLTMALQSHSEDDSFENYSGLVNSRRRRSVNSNVSHASTVDLTCDTGLTTPARTSSPSPRVAQVGFVPTVPGQLGTKAPQPPSMVSGCKQEKKRSISFACAAKPLSKPAEMPPPPKPIMEDAPKKPCIKFACVGRPASAQQSTTKPPQHPAPSNKSLSPAASRNRRSPSTHSRTARSVTPKRTTDAPAVRFRNYLTADSKDLQDESSEFHEFARDEIREEDWIRQDQANAGRRLTIDDTLKMELAIRRLGKEVEDEVAEENQEAEDEDDYAEAETADLDDADNVDEDEVEGAGYEDDHSGYGSDDDDSSAGYHTDEELGFAESDDDEDDELVLWTTASATAQSGGTLIPIGSLQRRTSVGEFSDSSAFSPGRFPQLRPRMPRLSPRPAPRPDTPELPDSTDFVCGTLDEDRPLEEAYMSCIAAKKREKEMLHLIPQDIDPSFPTSEPDDDDDNEHFKPLHRNSDDHLWLHGELEDLDHEGDRAERRKKKVDSPRRYHSPPPRRHHSPPQRVRGRSPPPPRRLFDRPSPPRRLRSPPPSKQNLETSSQASSARARPADEQHVAFKTLAFRPGPTHTKSLPRAPAIFAAHHARHTATTHHRRTGGGKAAVAPATKAAGGKHVRGAIDIVKGLEQRRQRRKEKFKEKMCNRARKGLAHEKRPEPGKGAERMRELGLLMAGKLVPGNYVLSV